MRAHLLDAARVRANGFASGSFPLNINIRDRVTIFLVCEMTTHQKPFIDFFNNRVHDVYVAGCCHPAGLICLAVHHPSANNPQF